MGQEKDKKRNNFSKGLWRTYLKIHLVEVVQGTSLLSHLHLHGTKALRFCAVSCPELLHSCIMTTVSPSSTVWLSSRECTTFIATEEPWLSINVVLVWNSISSNRERANAVHPSSQGYHYWKFRCRSINVGNLKKEWLPYVSPDFFAASQMEVQMLC